MKKYAVIFLVAAAAILLAYGMGRQRNRNGITGEHPRLENADTSRQQKSEVVVRNDSSQALAAYPDLDLVKGHSATGILRDYEGFRLAFNPDNRTPDWVAWELLGSEISGGAARSNKFWQDSALDNCPTSADYARSGYDRGHMCPAADQKWSMKAMEDCFVMANMCPQDHSLNSGAWNTLENRERVWARRDSAIIIVAGPIYEKSDIKRIGNAGVRVPGAFYKVIIAPYVDQPRGIAFIFPNMSSPGSMQNYVTTIDDVEKITGLDFFYALPDDIENRVESTASFKEWDRK